MFLRFISTFFLLTLFLFENVVAEEQCCSKDSVKEKTAQVRVRAIKATDSLGKDDVNAKKDFAKDISDLSVQLGKIPYKSFKLVSTSELDIPLMKRETFTIAEGNHVTVRPLSLDNNKVCLWLRWDDESGMKVIDTRMHFEIGQSMVAGTEHNEESGMILAVDVREQANR